MMGATHGGRSDGTRRSVKGMLCQQKELALHGRSIDIGAL